MIEALVVSNILAWIVIVGLALLVLALTRQIGILHERVAPAGALLPTSGPKVGELTDAMTLATLNDAPVTIGGVAEDVHATLVLFVSPTCPVCKTLVPTALSLVASEAGRLRLILASDGDTVEQHKAYIADLQLRKTPYVVSQELGMRYGVSKLPFALLIGRDGILKSKGLVNTREHLESLVESMDTGVATLQDFVNERRTGIAPNKMEQVS